MVTQTNETPNNFWSGFLLGGVIAGASVFFLGTKGGKKLLEDLVEHIEEHDGGLADTVDTLKEKSVALLEKTQEVKDAVIEQLEAKKDEVSESVVSHIDQTLSSIEDVQKQGIALTEEVHHKYFKKGGKKLST